MITQEEQMKIRILFLTVLLYLFIPALQSNAQNVDNPFFVEWNTPFNTPPFNDIKTEHFLPAFEESIKQQKAEIDAIVNDSAEPTFENTIEAVELSGSLLMKVNFVFNNLNSTDGNEEMEKIAQESAKMLAKHNNDIYLNENLFSRVKSIYQKREKLQLSTEQKTVLENYYLDFVDGGANLTPEEKDKFRKINEELAQLTVKFGENVRKENSNFQIIVDNEEDLIGLNNALVQSAKEKAEAKGLNGKWIFTLDEPTRIPFLKYSANRELREKLYKGYINRGNNNNEFDNKKIFSRIISLRVEKAHLLGYNTYADYKLLRRMAKKPENVYKFLNDIMTPALQKGKIEVSEMQKLIDEEGGGFKLQPWDWWYYSEKLYKSKFDFDAEILRPYFKLENVLEGAFTLANKLYGITFTQRIDIQVYNPEVKVYEVKEADGKQIGIFYTDYFPRESKGSGAWCDAFRNQSNIKNNFVYPIVTNVGNFTKPIGDKPALLSLDDVSTLFHEFGHALHALLQNVNYPYSSNVTRDFVELPSQIMENWAFEPEVLKFYAKHYQTGNEIPAELLKKIRDAEFLTLNFWANEYLAASLLDMDWHSVSDTLERDVNLFEKQSIQKMNLLPEINPRYLSTNFLHIAYWGYEAGYYSYMWAQVLDADAFEAFKGKGLFDKATAESFRKKILEKGASEDPMNLYVKFRGREPDVKPLIKRLGLE
jgi:peptidyl-dipeptidase Dcp